MAVKKDEKHGTWYYYGRYTDALGNRKQYKKRGFRTKKEAKEAEQAFLVNPTNHTKMTLDEVVSLYVNRASVQAIKQSTIFTNMSMYKTHIKPVFGRLDVSAITANKIEAWLIDMQNKKFRGKPLTVNTINQAKATLSKFLNYALRLGLINVNHCKLVPNIKPVQSDPTDNLHENFWELSEFEQFISSVDDDQWKDVFYFLFDTGVRRGEMLALKWKDIDFKNRTASIKATLTYRGIAKGATLTSPKTKRSMRIIDLPESLIKRLKMRYERESKKDGFTLDYFVFGDVTPTAQTSVYNYLNKYIKKSGVKKITVHGFRHSHASLLIEKGLPDALIAERLGHTVNELHKTYAHIYKRRRDEMKSKLDAIF